MSRYDQISKDFIIQKYKLVPHPEGGYFTESFRSDVPVTVNSNSKVRTASTAIYFLMTPGNISRLHRIQSDEVWHFYLGGSISVIELDEATGGFRRTILGHDILKGESVQYTCKAGTWFGSFPNAPVSDEDAFSLVGCTVSPGFEFEDFQLGSRSKLLEQFPNATEIVEKLTEGLP
jgi:predicted cupin superfamily sugar epimerase